METYSLINGFEIPKVAYGSAIVDTYRYYSDSKKTKIKYFVKNRIKNSKQFKKDMGLRNILKREHGTILIDTSRAYAGSEAIIGKYANDKTIICTKICNSDQIAGTIKKGVNKSLKELRREQIDILLMHWPVTGKYIDTWKYIEELYNNRKVKAIGVCNCNIHHLEEIKDKCDILPMINQFECHPLFNQEELREYCRLNNIQVMAYTATARMDERLKNTKLPEIAKQHKKSVAQTIIRWHIQNGNIPIINTSSYEHYLENKYVFDFRLSDKEMKEINDININSRLRYDPDNCDFSKL